MKKKTASRLYRLVAMLIFCCVAEAGALYASRQTISGQKEVLQAQKDLIDVLYSDVEREHKKFKEMQDYSWKLERTLKRRHQ
jgi:hypothetical protein